MVFLRRISSVLKLPNILNNRHCSAYYQFLQWRHQHGGRRLRRDCAIFDAILIRLFCFGQLEKTLSGNVYLKSIKHMILQNKINILTSYHYILVCLPQNGCEIAVCLKWVYLIILMFSKFIIDISCEFVNVH